MTRESYVLENSNGQTIRFIDWHTNNLFIVYRHDLRKVEFLADIKELQDKNIEFDLISEVTKSQVAKSNVQIKPYGVLKLVETVAPSIKEVEPTQEDEKKFPIFFKYSAAGYVGVLLLMFLSAYIAERFFQKPIEPVVVTVYQQEREPTPTVNVSEHKIEKRVVTHQKVSNHTVQRKPRLNVIKTVQNVKVVSRPGTSVVNRGALSVLGGMSKNATGSGGLNLKAQTNNPGIGYGGIAARGGYEKGLVGKGLIATGVGNGGSLKGYGGYGTNGKGGGRPGYGTLNMAGSSGAYFSPLSDEALIEGGLDRDQINAVIQRNIGQVHYCYESGLQSAPNLSGRVAIKFTIDGNGIVNVANVANTSLRSSKVESCILSKLRSWRFPRPVGNVNVRVNYPFVLKRLSQG